MDGETRRRHHACAKETLRSFSLHRSFLLYAGKILTDQKHLLNEKPIWKFIRKSSFELRGAQKLHSEFYKTLFIAHNSKKSNHMNERADLGQFFSLPHHNEMNRNQAQLVKNVIALKLMESLTIESYKTCRVVSRSVLSPVRALAIRFIYARRIRRISKNIKPSYSIEIVNANTKFRGNTFLPTHLKS